MPSAVRRVRHPDTQTSVKANPLPSKSPLSLSFSSGITGSAMNESVMNGARSGEPSRSRARRVSCA